MVYEGLKKNPSTRKQDPGLPLAGQKAINTRALVTRSEDILVEPTNWWTF